MTADEGHRKAVYGKTVSTINEGALVTLDCAGLY